MFIFCKIYFYIYVYIFLIYKIVLKIYIDLQLRFKKKITKILYLIFWVLWYNLLIHLKVLKIKYKNGIKVYVDFDFYVLKWTCLYYYFYVIYILKDLSKIINWLLFEFQWYILYLQIKYYLKNKKLEFYHYTELFIKGYLFIFYFSDIINYIKNLKNIFKWKSKKKKQNRSFVSNIKFYYHRNKRIFKEKYYMKVTKPLLHFGYFINNLIEYVYLVFFKMGANIIISYFYKFLKYSYSICVYIWKSDIIYRVLKLILGRKKW